MGTLGDRLIPLSFLALIPPLIVNIALQWKADGTHYIVNTVQSVRLPPKFPTVQWKADAARSYYGSSTNYQGGICKVQHCIATLPLPDTIILVISPPILPSLTLAPGGGATTSQPLLSSSVLGRVLQF